MPILMCDLDDTLIDRDEAFGRWAQNFAREHDLPFAATTAWLVKIDDRGYAPREGLIAAIDDRYQVWPDRAAALVRFRRDLAMMVPELGLVCRTLLVRLRQSGWKIAVVTNGTQAQQDLKVQVSGLAPLLDACVVSEAAGCRKPDPAIFRAAALACGCNTEGGWMMGDNPELDIVGASATGMETIWVHHGRHWTVPDMVPTVQVDSTQAGLRWLVDREYGGRVSMESDQ